MENYVGKRLDGRYEVQEIIGVGGMSVVYKAYDNVDDRIVAVKILKEEFSNSEEFKRRFKNESKAIALLSHPNIVKVYDVNFGEKLQYIVMEYIDGITLKEYINKQGAITWNDALFFMSQILKAVQHAHDKGIVHRDIKPQNIILLSTGNIKVTDFGIARFSRSETKTLTEQAIGSVHYIAPEQAKGEKTDEKADIYSLGVVLYEMLSGTVPFEADSAVSVALMQLQNDAEKLTDINPDIPLGLEQICIRAMQKNPLDRYQSATEMLLDIEEIIKNPETTFNYSYTTSKVDSNPTKVIDKQEFVPAPEPIEELEEDDFYPDPDRKKKIATAIIIGLIVLGAAVALLIMAVSNPIGKTVTLENYVGRTYDEVFAENEKSSNKFKISAEYEKTKEAEAGKIIKQTPEAGTKVMQGTELVFVVAASMDDIKVPNVYDRTEQQAKDMLDEAGLTTYTVLSVASENVEIGKVVYTDPKANMVASAETEIKIYVSSGPTTTENKKLKMPDVYGLTQSGARAFLEKYGFKKISFATQDSPMPKGTVISQTPSAGAEISEKDSVKLVISSGVTSTSTEEARRVGVSIKLPTVIDKNGNYVKDTVVIKVDNESVKSVKVPLDGKTKNYDIQGFGKDKKTVSVSINKTGAKDTKSISGKKNETLNFSFDDFSSDSHTEPADDETSKS
ncbi:MAG: Stk1 family PASTA domain-containing Ser/Thr kinase [Eubacterium sp.]|nr:Stk1 family PASTA domain-containing Ser/Thr kinase [Eubacterium sp.]